MFAQTEEIKPIPVSEDERSQILSKITTNLHQQEQELL
jgi:hypothetical protein